MRRPSRRRAGSRSRASQRLSVPTAFASGSPASRRRRIARLPSSTRSPPSVRRARPRLRQLPRTPPTASIRDKRPPEALTLAFEGKGGPGFVRGSAAIALSDNGGTTNVACEADVQVGGLIAAVGSRLVEATAKKLADDFFRQLSTALQ